MCISTSLSERPRFLWTEKSDSQFYAWFPIPTPGGWRRKHRAVCFVCFCVKMERFTWPGGVGGGVRTSTEVDCYTFLVFSCIYVTLNHDGQNVWQAFTNCDLSVPSQASEQSAKPLAMPQLRRTSTGTRGMKRRINLQKGALTQMKIPLLLHYGLCNS